MNMRRNWYCSPSVCNLAAGRPVVLQDTGFRHTLPVGQGLLCFSDLEGACQAVEAVEDNYREHQRAARAVAEQCFEAGLVLDSMLRSVGL